MTNQYIGFSVAKQAAIDESVKKPDTEYYVNWVEDTTYSVETYSDSFDDESHALNGKWIDADWADNPVNSDGWE